MSLPPDNIIPFDGCSDGIAPPKKRFQTIEALKYSDCAFPKWIIKHIFPRAELGVIYGESGCGKSFLALDMAMAITRGIDWQGYKTSKGRIVYVCAEGSQGFRNRLMAYSMHHSFNLGEVPRISTSSRMRRILLGNDDADLLSRAILETGPADVRLYRHAIARNRRWGRKFRRDGRKGHRPLSGYSPRNRRVRRADPP